MIRVHIEFMDQKLKTFRVEGHQLSRATDQSFGLVCNSVSVTVQNLQEAIIRLVSDTEFDLCNEKGLCLIRRKNLHRLGKNKEEILDILVKVSLIGLKRIEKHHPDHLNIRLEENRGDHYGSQKRCRK